MLMGDCLLGCREVALHGMQVVFGLVGLGFSEVASRCIVSTNSKTLPSHCPRHDSLLDGRGVPASSGECDTLQIPMHRPHVGLEMTTLSVPPAYPHRPVSAIIKFNTLASK